MPQSLRPEIETPNVGETNNLETNATSDGVQPTEEAPSVTVEVATESPIQVAPGEETLGEQWEREQAEQAELQRQLERHQEREQNRHDHAIRRVPQPTQQMIDTARALGLDAERWSDDKIAQMEALFKAGTIPIVTSVLLIQGMDSIAQCQKAYKVLGELGENQATSSEVRVAAYKAIAETVKAHCAMSEHALFLAKETDTKKNSEQPRVLPPNLNVQVNFPPGLSAPQLKMATANLGQGESGMPKPGS